MREPSPQPLRPIPFPLDLSMPSCTVGPNAMRLTTGEHIRRFLIHILPDGFHRIRHYGLLASAARKANIAKVRSLLAAAQPETTPQAADSVTPLALREPCTCCVGPMSIVEIFRHGQKPQSRAPPRERVAC